MGRKILIVEDDMSMQTVLTQALHQCDKSAQVDWVDNAESAIERLRQSTHDQAYDLVIADVFLSGEKSGLELWQQCEQTLPEVPVLLMSAMGVQEFFEKIGHGTVSPPFLPKPFRVGEFKQVATSLLGTPMRSRFESYNQN